VTFVTITSAPHTLAMSRRRLGLESHDETTNDEIAMYARISIALETIASHHQDSRGATIDEGRTASSSDACEAIGARELAAGETVAVSVRGEQDARRPHSQKGRQVGVSRSEGHVEVGYFAGKPTNEHWMACNTALRYLKPEVHELD
jgi:hypothetical protein